MMNLSSPTSPLILLRRPVGAERCIKSIIFVRNLAPWPQGAGEDEVSKGGAFQVEAVASLRTRPCSCWRHLIGKLISMHDMLLRVFCSYLNLKKHYFLVSIKFRNCKVYYVLLKPRLTLHNCFETTWVRILKQPGSEIRKQEMQKRDRRQ